MIMYLWKGIEIGSSNRYIRQAFNNMRNNADRIKKKKDSLQSKGRPEELPADKVYELRSEGKKAKEIAEILSNEGYKDGNVTEQNVSNSKG
jgi:16S rRNA C967 or C1407 C5-methylase (RsmB/RsmF family)